MLKVTAGRAIKTAAVAEFSDRGASLARGSTDVFMVREKHIWVSTATGPVYGIGRHVYIYS